ncbi:MAG: InlB B-repeat-containing protein [Candidatus Acetothermia bacterium]
MGWRKFGAASLVFLSLGLMVLPGAGQARRQAEIEVRPANPTEDDSITLVLSGRWPNSCTPESPRVRATGSRITVETSNSSEACLQKITPWELKVPVGELSADTYRVTVNFEGETIGRERFEVEESEPELVDLEVEPSSLGLGVGEQEQLISWAIYHHNGLGEKKDVTDEARWRSSDTSVAVVSKGLVSGEGPGEARINAIYEGERGSASVAVEAEEYLLDVDIQGEGEVRNGEIDCPPDCSETYSAGSRLSLTAEAPPGWEFDRWTGCDLETHDGECSLKMDEDREVLAIFEKETEECVLEVTSSQGGTTEPELGSHPYPCGEMVEVEAIPVEGWEFTGWELTGSVADQFPPFPNDNPIKFELQKDGEFDYDAGLFAHFAQDEEPTPPSAREVNVEILPEDAEPGEPATVHVYGTWENGCIPRYDDLEVESYSPGIMINTINESEHCTMAITDFDLEADVKELPTAFHVDVYYKDLPQDTLELIASEWFSQ